MAKKDVFVDIETSGLSPKDGHVILSIGAVYKEKEFYAVIAPTEEEFALAAPEALKVNGFTYEQLLAEGLPFQEVLTQFCNWVFSNYVKKGLAQIIGQNPKFDIMFLRHYMGNALNFLLFPWDDVVDVRDLYSIMVNRGKLPRLQYRSGANIAKALGVEGEPEIHNALEGALLARRNYEKLVELGVYES